MKLELICVGNSVDSQTLEVDPKGLEASRTV